MPAPTVGTTGDAHAVANLEKTLRRALALANARQHEYATLEHLLMALTEDQDAVAVLKACAVELERLRASLMDFLDHELSGLVGRGRRSTPSRPPASSASSSAPPSTSSRPAARR